MGFPSCVATDIPFFGHFLSFLGGVGLFLANVGHNESVPSSHVDDCEVIGTGRVEDVGIHRPLHQ